VQQLSPLPISFRSWTTPGLAAVRRYWRPFLLLQSCALALVIAYYASSNDGPVRTVCRNLSHVKQTYGILFVALSAAFAGAILPEITKVLALGERRFDHARWANIAFALAAFAFHGFITDYQYRLLALLFGHDASFATAIKKVLADQFGTTPLYGVPYWVLVYGWKNHGFHVGRTLRELGPRWYLSKVMPLLIPAWAFWIPMTLLIYILPGELQFCMFLLVLAAWSLIMVFVADRPATHTTNPATPAHEPQPAVSKDAP
jgi:hypothetical protein